MKKYVLATLIAAIVLLNSCATKKIIYVNDMKQDSVYRTVDVPAIHIQKNDRLNIVVSAKNPELAIPFNQINSNYRVSESGHVETANSLAAETLTKGYLVDDNGMIDFPILGTLPVEGKTLSGVKELIKARLIQDKYINEPIIRVELVNLKINMMGEVASVGVLNVPDGRITLLEAISRSGGLTNNATPDRITVIREEGGERKMIVSNIQTKDIFNSPAYYLQQNDIVYVEPKAAVSTPKEERNWRAFTIVLSLTTMVFTFLNWMK